MKMMKEEQNKATSNDAMMQWPQWPHLAICIELRMQTQSSRVCGEKPHLCGASQVGQGLRD